MELISRLYCGKKFLSEEKIDDTQRAFDDFTCSGKKDQYMMIFDLDESEEHPQSIFYWDEEQDYFDEIDCSIDMENFIEEIFH